MISVMSRFAACTVSRLLASTRIRNTADGVEDLLRVRDRQSHGLVDVEPAREPLLGEHADDAAARVADAHPLAHGAAGVEQLARDGVAEHADRRRACRGRRAAGTGPTSSAQCWIAAIGSLVPSTVTSRSRERHDTVPAPTTSGVTCATRELRVQRDRVLERELARRLADQEPLDAAAGRLGLARQHDQEVRAERLELARDVAARAFADGRERDHGRDADRDRDQQHRGAQRVAPQRLEREPRRVDATS